ncbi:MAG: 2-aminoethylphosphonate--pyruvate transaminase [Cyclobacteriaceae bacterium]
MQANFDANENAYLLLTPGPLSTSPTVRSAMQRDWCTWDQEYHLIVQDIRSKLLCLSNGTDDFTTVLMQGSGSFVVESVLWTNLDELSHILVLVNGAYGARMAHMVKGMGRKLTIVDVAENKQFDPEKIEAVLQTQPGITHIGVVHCETTTGMLNRYEPLAALAQQYNKIFILDAMSSFGGIPIDVTNPPIHFLISSANKCIQGVPGFGFVIAHKASLEKCKGVSRSHCLDLYDQWNTMENNSGKWRFTSPTHTVRAFLQALKELEDEGGVKQRHKRFVENHHTITESLKEHGINTFLQKQDQSPFITAFEEPSSKQFNFDQLYIKLKENGFVIYPGKVSNAATFRIGHIGHVFPEDFRRLSEVFKEIIFW